MKPYSIDFRQKILEVYEFEKISIRKLAERFRVAKSFVQKLLKQSQKTILKGLPGTAGFSLACLFLIGIPLLNLVTIPRNN